MRPAPKVDLPRLVRSCGFRLRIYHSGKERLIDARSWPGTRNRSIDHVGVPLRSGPEPIDNGFDVVSASSRPLPASPTATSIRFGGSIAHVVPSPVPGPTGIGTTMQLGRHWETRCFGNAPATSRRRYRRPNTRALRGDPVRILGVPTILEERAVDLVQGWARFAGLVTGERSVRSAGPVIPSSSACQSPRVCTRAPP